MYLENVFFFSFCLSEEECPDESVTVLHTGLHEFAFSFNLPQM